jgi:hypothetical protein
MSGLTYGWVHDSLFDGKVNTRPWAEQNFGEVAVSMIESKKMIIFQPISTACVSVLE